MKKLVNQGIIVNRGIINQGGFVMKGKIIKLITVMLLLVTLTTINFIYVGASFISLAAEEISTNHKNIEFTSTLKSENLLTLTVVVKN